ncbi:DUF4382 domain-containing protein [Pleurocapsales cyanobacterium LEGE 06147]|nr:DUF4382 domain-containing protein [Pleurocapsales cyanobacterium LEGE 06147]
MQKIIILVSAIALSPIFLSGCERANTPNIPNTADTTETETATTQTGTLTLVANGEDFIRQGFVTKDGWRVNFDRVYVTLADVKTYQTEPPFDPEAGSEIEPQETVVLVDTPTTVDLAEGDEDAEPIVVTQTEAPAGAYNVLTWRMVRGEEGSPAADGTIVMNGTATREDRAIDFLISLDRELEYVCGEFVGEERKGILQAGDTAEVETTFHFDHIFGSADAPADDALNQDALGFEPLAALAQNDKLEVDQATLQQELSPQDYQTLQEAIAGLGHVGEGHCSVNS